MEAYFSSKSNVPMHVGSKVIYHFKLSMSTEHFVTSVSKHLRLKERLIVNAEDRITIEF